MTDGNIDANVATHPDDQAAAPAVSVVIPVYNQQAYIGDCLESIARQTYDDVEIIVVDDGSTDGSAAETAEYAKRDARITLLAQPNAGVSAARNHGLADARGEWVCFIDPDDTVGPRYLETLMAAAHEDTDIVMSACVACGTGGEERQHFFPQPFTASDAEHKRPLYHQLIDGSYAQPKGFVTAIGVPWGKLYRRSFLKAQRLRFDPQLPRMQDNIFNMQAFAAARSIVYIDAAEYRYRVGGLGERTYRNHAQGLYHPAIDARARLMHAYGLDKDRQLYAAWQEEQVNLYFQEYKAAIMLAPSGKRVAAANERVRQLRQRLTDIDTSVLSAPIRLKYTMMRNPVLRAAAASAIGLRQCQGGQS